MPVWDSRQYLKFAGERTQPAIDLLARVPDSEPKRVIDLGCGPGNSTELLAVRWPDATIVGLDNSAEMLAKARADHPSITWIEGEIGTWKADQPYDVIFANAALQWVPDHARVMPALLRQLAPGGSLAIQMPRNQNAPTHTNMREAASAGPWSPLLASARESQRVEVPGFYYDLLAPLTKRLEIWETEYQHVMDGAEGIVEWVKGTGLRPYIEPLPPKEREAYLALYLKALKRDYPPQANGKVIMPFRRIFIVATI
ncbi:MAG TPA: trans-aconitate 2-methyltransferase [Candidatus Cybelea sp.]|nr:trans-aconitate 2-methyltransferase [Candidatus Cybelea sp.]